MLQGGEQKPVLFAYTDGGGDHRSTYLSVQLSWILLFYALDLDMLVMCRTAPGHSYDNPAERCMSTLNLAPQNCALSREKLSEEAEKRFKPCSGMSAIRSLPPVLHKAWAKAVAPVQEVVAK